MLNVFETTQVPVKGGDHLIGTGGDCGQISVTKIDVFSNDSLQRVKRGRLRVQIQPHRRG